MILNVCFVPFRSYLFLELNAKSGENNVFHIWSKLRDLEYGQVCFKGAEYSHVRSYSHRSSQQESKI